MTFDTADLTAADGTSLVACNWPAESPRATMLLVNGLSDHVGRWNHVAEHFVARGYDVHSYDHRGHGRSGGARMDVPAFEPLVDDLELMARRVQRSDRPFVIYAHSLGGLMAVAYAETDRPQPDVYVFSAPALGASLMFGQRTAIKTLGRLAGRIRINSPIKGDQLCRDPAVGEAYFDDDLVGTSGTVRTGKAIIDAIDHAREDASKIRTPALVIHGSDDTIVPPRSSAILAGVEGIERKLFPGLRHEMHNEPESAEVLNFVSGWLESVLFEGNDVARASQASA